MRFVAFPFFSSLFLFNTFANASDIDQSSNIIVTATRTAVTADETISPVTVITAEDIKRLQIQSVPQALAYSAGVEVVSSGGDGSLASLFMRGSNSDHVLYIVDGVTVGSASSGLMSLQLLPIDMIERIEVVRGSRSSLYGADAIGGVVQIFTHKGKNTPMLQTDLSIGNRGKKKLNALFSFQQQENHYNLAVGAYQTDGYDFVGNSGNNHGFDNQSLNFSGRTQISDKISLNHVLLHSRGNSQFDGSFVNNSDFVEQVAGVELKYQAMESWDMRFKLNQSRSDLLNNRDKVFISKFNSKRFGLSWQNELQVNENSLLTLGLDYEDLSLDSNSIFVKTSRWNKAAFAQYQWFSDLFDLQFALRQDNNESYANKQSGNISLSVPINNKLRSTFSYATAFKAPSFNDLYYPLEQYPAYSEGGATSSYSGNLAIKPETSKSFELGLKYQQDNNQLELNLFNNKISDLIEYVTVFDPVLNHSSGTMDNIASADINGLEFIYQTKFYDINIRSELTYIHAINADSKKRLPLRSRYTYQLNMDKSWGKYSYGATIKAASHRFIDVAEQYAVAGYAVADLRFAYQIDKQWTFKTVLNNVLNKKYAQTARFALSQKYWAPERSVMASIHYAMK